MKRTDAIKDALYHFTAVILAFIIIAGLLLIIRFCFGTVYAQTPTGEFEPTNVCYWDRTTKKLVTEIFQAPKIDPDFGPVKYINGSPIDPTRQFENIPTFGLAKWHWWLFSTVLFRAQRQYSDCIGGVKAYQKILGESPLIDQAPHPSFAQVINVREYEIFFDVVQNVQNKQRPPAKDHAVTHIKAAVDSVNNTVFNIGICQSWLQDYESKVRAKLK